MEEMKKSWQERLSEQEAANKVSLEICLAGLIHSVALHVIWVRSFSEKLQFCQDTAVIIVFIIR